MIQIDSENNISLTRGDTGLFTISLTDKQGEPYTPAQGSKLRFAMSKKYGADNEEVLVTRQIPINTMTLEILPEDTKELKFKEYVYDIELTDENDRVSTVILAKFNVTEEVY